MKTLGRDQLGTCSTRFLVFPPSSQSAFRTISPRAIRDWTLEKIQMQYPNVVRFYTFYRFSNGALSKKTFIPNQFCMCAPDGHVVKCHEIWNFWHKNTCRTRLVNSTSELKILGTFSHHFKQGKNHHALILSLNWFLKKLLYFHNTSDRNGSMHLLLAYSWEISLWKCTAESGSVKVKIKIGESQSQKSHFMLVCIYWSAPLLSHSQFHIVVVC